MTEAKARDEVGASPWWVAREVAVDRGLRFELGPLALSLVRRPGEWQLYRETIAPETDGSRWAVAPVAELDAAPDGLQRYAVRGEQHLLRLSPALPGRTVVARPRMPLFVPPGEAIRVFVSSPVEIRVAVGEPWLDLVEVPTAQLSDTWVGGSTRDGELAYALRTLARMRLEEMPPQPHRAVTPLVLSNRAEDMLAVERVNLPVTYLSVYATSRGRLWTEEVTMSRDESAEMAALAVGSGAPPEAGEAQLLTGSRDHAERNLLVRAFSSLLHPFMRSLDDE